MIDSRSWIRPESSQNAWKASQLSTIQTNAKRDAPETTEGGVQRVLLEQELLLLLGRGILSTAQIVLHLHTGEKAGSGRGGGEMGMYFGQRGLRMLLAYFARTLRLFHC